MQWIATVSGMKPPTIDDVRRAGEILAGVAVRTPLVASPALTGRCGRPVFVKPETMQVTGSFKFRGAFHFVSRIPEAERGRGVVAYSSGNHAQGVAAAAARFGVPATIVMPSDAPAIKIARTRAHGATVVGYDRESESREEIAAGIAADTGATMLPPFDHPWTIAGQGTIGLEIAADWNPTDPAPIVLVPCGGGGLASGIAIALAAVLAGASVHLVEPDGFDDHARSLVAGHRVGIDRTSGSICDALLSPMPGELTFAVNQRLAGGAHVVSDESVLAAMRTAFEELRLVVEPGGAVGLAALLDGMVPGAGPVVVVLSGGNVDPALFARAIGAS